MNTLEPLSDKMLLEQFKDCTLSPDQFTHENMLRIAYILLKKHGLENATLINCELKEQYFIQVLNSKKFNLPLTKAYTEILDYFMSISSAKTFEKLLKEFPRLKYNFNDLVKTHYGYNILKEHRKEELKPFNAENYVFTF